MPAAFAKTHAFLRREGSARSTARNVSRHGDGVVFAAVRNPRRHDPGLEIHICPPRRKLIAAPKVRLQGKRNRPPVPRPEGAELPLLFVGAEPAQAPIVLFEELDAVDRVRVGASVADSDVVEALQEGEMAR